jgi:hypothetical protein
MIDPFVVTMATALLVLFAFLCVGLHEILLSPDLPNYPNAGLHVRAAMFVFMVCLGYRGVEMLSLLFTQRVYVTPGAFWASFTLAWVQAVLLEQQLRRWLPARLHERIRRLLEIASCRKRPMLVAERARNNGLGHPASGRRDRRRPRRATRSAEGKLT